MPDHKLIFQCAFSKEDAADRAEIAVWVDIDLDDSLQDDESVVLTRPDPDRPVWVGELSLESPLTAGMAFRLKWAKAVSGARWGLRVQNTWLGADVYDKGGKVFYAKETVVGRCER